MSKCFIGLAPGQPPRYHQNQSIGSVKIYFPRNFEEKISFKKFWRKNFIQEISFHSVQGASFWKAAAKFEAKSGHGVYLGGALELSPGGPPSAAALDLAGRLEFEGEDASGALSGAASWSWPKDILLV